MRSIKIRVETPELVDYLCELLASYGYFYDEDFTALYAAVGWDITGIQLMGTDARHLSLIIALEMAKVHVTNAQPVALIMPYDPLAHQFMTIWFNARVGAGYIDARIES